MAQPGRTTSDHGWPPGVGFVCRGLSPRDGIRKNRHQLMSRFARDLPVLNVGPWYRLPLRNLRSSLRSIGLVWKELRGPALRDRDGDVKKFSSPAYLPVSGSASVRRATLGMWIRRVRRGRAANEIEIRRPILRGTPPDMQDVTGRLLELLLDLARELKEGSIVLAGRVDPLGCELLHAQLRTMSNVCFPGELAAADVPAHIATFDVGQLPYRLNRESEHISPLKLHECLASGNPVISTPVPAAKRHAELLRLANSGEQFARAGREMLAGEHETLPHRRRAYPARSTCEHRVDRTRSVLQRPLRDGPSRDATKPHHD